MAFELPRKSLQEGMTKTMVCRVAELVDEHNIVKGFKLVSVIGEVGKKKEEQQKQEGGLDSFIEQEELM